MVGNKPSPFSSNFPASLVEVRRYSWPSAGAAPSSSSMAPHSERLQRLDLTGNGVLHLSKGDRLATVAAHGQDRQLLDSSLPRVLCTRCGRLAEPSSVDMRRRRSRHGGPRNNGTSTLPSDKGLTWSCTCGSFVSSSRHREESMGEVAFATADRAHVDHEFLNQAGDTRVTKKRKKLKHKLSKVHRVLLSTLGVTTEASSLNENDSADSARDEFHPSTSNHSLTSSRAESAGISNGAEYEVCSVTECNDTNGKYVVVEQVLAPAADGASLAGARTKVSEKKSSSSLRNNNSSSSMPPVLENEDTSLRDVNVRPSTLTSTPGSSKTSTNSDSGTPCSNSAAQWPRSSTPSSSSNLTHPVCSEENSEIARSSQANVVKSVNSLPAGPSYKASTEDLYLPLNQETPRSLHSKKSSRKKKRSGSWYNVLSPSYRQKNDDLHKFFKHLPDGERLLGDHSCALVKDILIQGRLYVSQNYVCFHSKFLKLQTAISIEYKEIESLTKEKTVKVIPNAIQIQTKSRKCTFTSFTSRDRVFQQLTKLWDDARQSKSMTPQALMDIVRDHYGHDLGCSSDDELLKTKTPVDSPVRKDDNDTVRSKKSKWKKTPSQRDTRVPSSDASSSPANGTTEIDGRRLATIADQSIADDKSSSRGSLDGQDTYADYEDSPDGPENGNFVEEEEVLGPAEHAIPDFKRLYMTNTFNVSVDHMYETIYGENNPFWKNHLSREANDIVISNWTDGTSQHEGHKVRVLEYQLILSNPLGPKTSRVIETQVLNKNSEPGGCYAVDCTAQMLGVPYGDYFTTIMRYCMRRVCSNTCELKISASLHFVKTPIGFVKSFIEKNCYSGIDDNFRNFGSELNEHFEQEKARQPVVIPTSRPPLKDLPLPGQSVSSATEVRRRKAPTHVNSVENYRQSANKDETHRPNGVVRTSDVIPPKPTISVPASFSFSSPDVGSNTSVHVSTATVTREGRFGLRWRNGALAFVFGVLLLSNLSMYYRLNSLEQSRDFGMLEWLRMTETEKPWSSIFQLSAPDTAANVAAELKQLKGRVADLESTVKSQVATSDERWNSITAHWQNLDRKIDLVLENLQSNSKT